MIKLIINADDFGYSKVFNEKILNLLEKGFIKSTTVMVNRITKYQDKQVRKLIELHKKGSISIGLHVEHKQMKTNIEEQYEKFIYIFGFPPSHLDIHKHIDNLEALREINKFAKYHNIPVRNHGIKSGTKQTTHLAFFCSNWVMKLDEVLNFLKKVKDGESCELITHPGDYDPDSTSSLNKERRTDYETIIKFQNFLKSHRNIRNISYLDL